MYTTPDMPLARRRKPVAHQHLADIARHNAAMKPYRERLARKRANEAISRMRDYEIRDLMRAPGV